MTISVALSVASGVTWLHFLMHAKKHYNLGKESYIGFCVGCWPHKVVRHSHSWWKSCEKEERFLALTSLTEFYLCYFTPWKSSTWLFIVPQIFLHLLTLGLSELVMETVFQTRSPRFLVNKMRLSINNLGIPDSRYKVAGFFTHIKSE